MKDQKIAVVHRFCGTPGIRSGFVSPLGPGEVGVVRLVVVLAVIGLVALTACGPDPADPPTPSPTPVVKPTPTPDAQAQALIDAEKAYRTNVAERSRLGMAGGAMEMPAAITNTATGRYLRIIELEQQGIKRARLHSSAPTTIVGVIPSWRAGTVELTTCEDLSRVRLLDAEGHDRTPADTGTRLYRQSITLIKTGGRWNADQDRWSMEDVGRIN